MKRLCQEKNETTLDNVTLQNGSLYCSISETFCVFLSVEIVTHLCHFE